MSPTDPTVIGTTYDALRVLNPNDPPSVAGPLVLARIRRQDDDRWHLQLLPDVHPGGRLPWQMFARDGSTMTDPLNEAEARQVLMEAATLLDDWLKAQDERGQVFLDAFTRLGRRATPTVRAKRVVVMDNPEQGKVRTVVIDCPICGREHTHGWPLGSDDDPGHRAAHCAEDVPGKSSGYNITAPTARGGVLS